MPWRRLDPLPAMLGVWWLALGGWLVLPWSTFDSNPAFSTIREFGPEPVIGTVGLLIGLAAVQRSSMWIRYAGLFCAVLAAGFSLFVFASANWRGLSVPIWGTVLVGHIWGFAIGTRLIRLRP